MATRATWSGMFLGLVVTAALGACFEPDLPDVAFRCGSDGACPTGYECMPDGCCHKKGAPYEPADFCRPPEAGGVDAAVDAAVSDTDGALVDGGPGSEAGQPGDGGSSDGQVDATSGATP